MASLIKSFFYLTSLLPQLRNTPAQRPNGVETDVGGKTFDYIVVGGGLTGLTVANRLSEDSSRKCLSITVSTHGLRH